MSVKIIDFSGKDLNVATIQEHFGNSLLDDQKNGVKHFILDFTDSINLDVDNVQGIMMKLTMLGGLVELEGGKCILTAPQRIGIRAVAPIILGQVPSCALCDSLEEAKSKI